jgi:hypothetical protein
MEGVMSVTRRTFLAGLSALFGAASMPDLKARILDKGAPILLTPSMVAGNLYVYETGLLNLGEEDPDMPRPTWRQLWHDEGSLDGNDNRAVRMEASFMLGDAGAADDLVDNFTWAQAYELVYTPMARAYRLLQRLDIGPSIRTRKAHGGRLDFFEGSNHPGSNDLWVEVYDDLSVSLLQARLIELGQPIRVVMETRTVIKPDGYF